MVNFSFWF